MFANVVVAIRLYLALLWWKICGFLLYVMHVKSLKPANQYLHKAVIIGDDFAAGIGDYITIGNAGGIAQYLSPIIAQSDKVRHRWEIINAGVPGSTSADWLLNAARQNYKNVFSSRSMGDAEIVIVILGSVELRDPKASTFEVKKNLASLCDTLRKKGKKVCLATVASATPLASDTETIPLNTALEEFCKSTSTEEIPVVLGPRLDTYAFRRENSLAYDRFHFNSSGYKLLARNTADFLIPMMTAIEWSTWKKQLNQVEYDKALYD
uniref:SGNH hydrolase-type esterase domain-containing protein n=1 Tax=Globisporangium ultimum (strain ATCC 200006 / CBS 805.95 / DAOM BR144) TaxID=431595 RepID=K3W6Y8_GLOUD